MAPRVAPVAPRVPLLLVVGRPRPRVAFQPRPRLEASAARRRLHHHQPRAPRHAARGALSVLLRLAPRLRPSRLARRRPPDRLPPAPSVPQGPTQLARARERSGRGELRSAGQGRRARGATRLPGHRSGERDSAAGPIPPRACPRAASPRGRWSCRTGLRDSTGRSSARPAAGAAPGPGAAATRVAAARGVAALNATGLSRESSRAETLEPLEPSASSPSLPRWSGTRRKKLSRYSVASGAGASTWVGCPRELRCCEVGRGRTGRGHTGRCAQNPCAQRRYRCRGGIGGAHRPGGGACASVGAALALGRRRFAAENAASRP